MSVDLNTLEILILLKCNKKMLSKTDITQIFKKYDKTVRALAVESLISKKLLLAQEMPKEGSNKIPMYYKLTENGKKWIEEYKKNYPTA